MLKGHPHRLEKTAGSSGAYMQNELCINSILWAKVHTSNSDTANNL